eukprot:1081385-Rhodomonas_salina.2
MSCGKLSVSTSTTRPAEPESLKSLSTEWREPKEAVAKSTLTVRIWRESRAPSASMWSERSFGFALTQTPRAEKGAAESEATRTCSRLGLLSMKTTRFS